MTATGSLCSGYGGLDRAVQSVFGGELMWCADIEPAPAAVLARHYPQVPNIGDITSCNWDDVRAVDVLTAGYPCPPFSVAGRQLGVEDARYIWPAVADAIRTLRPRLVVLENVAGHLRLGFDVVTADLHRMGYRFAWGVVRASDVGACHRRARLFVVAHDAESDPRRLLDGECSDASSDPDGGRLEVGVQRDGDTPCNPSHGRSRRDDFDGCGEAVADTEGERRGPWAGLRSSGPRGNGRGLAGDSDQEAPTVDAALWGIETSWGVYEPAIRRHEHVLGRRAPHPSDEQGRLSPRFVEWMMMLPEGWVTDVPNIGRVAMLRLLGNGVVPLCAEVAVRRLYASLMLHSGESVR